MDADVGRYTRVKALKGSVHGADDERAALCPASSTPTTSTPPVTASSAASAARAARAVRAVYFCLGAGLLAAWNALITGTDYFGAVYPGWHTDRLFTLAYLPLCMVSLAAAIRYPDVLSLAGRIRLGYAGFTLCMAAVPLLDALLVAPAAAAAPPGGDGGQQPPPGEVPAGALVAVLVCVAVVGVCDGLCQGALFGEAAQLPPPYTQAVVAGTASSGLLVCLLRVASKASFEAAAARREGQEGADAATRAGLRNGTRLYFALAGLLSFACLILYDFVLPPLRRRAGGALAAAAAAQDRDSGSSSSSSIPATAASGNDAAVERQPLLLQLQLPDASSAATLEVELSGDLGSVHGSEAAAAVLTGGAPAAAVAAGTVVGAGAGAEVGVAGGGSAALPVSTHANHHHHHHHSTNFGSPGAPATTNATSAAASAAAASPSSGSFRSAQLAGCVAASWPVCAGLFAVYGVTLSIFPGFLAEDVHSADLGDWYPILLITAFNAADLVGKTLPCVTPLPPPAPPLSAPSALAPSSSGSGPGSLAQRSAAKGRAAAAAAEGAAGRGQGLAARLAAAMLMPLRRPRGMLAASLVRGAVALPAFVAAAAWQAPAAVMAALTVLLGVSNGYLTSQLMTMGPSAVLPRPLLDSGASDEEEEEEEEEDGIGGDCERECEEAGAEESGEEATGGRGAEGMEEGRGRGIGAGLGRGLVGGGGGGGGVEGYVALPAAAVVAGTASALVDSGGGGGGDKAIKAGSAGKARRQQQQRKEPSSHYQEPNHEHHHHTHHADAEVVENLLVLSLVAGLNVGAVLGWLWLV